MRVEHPMMRIGLSAAFVFIACATGAPATKGSASAAKDVDEGQF